MKYYEDLQSSGTEHYYRHGLTRDLMHTDGVEIMCQKLQCYWLVDIVASYIHRLKKIDDTMFFPKLHLGKDSTAVFTIDDGGKGDEKPHIWITQEIPFTDCTENISLYLSMDEDRYVLYLPSEY